MKRKKLMKIGGISAALLIGLFLILPQMARADEDNPNQTPATEVAVEPSPVVEEPAPVAEEPSPIAEVAVADESEEEEPAKLEMPDTSDENEIIEEQGTNEDVPIEEPGVINNTESAKSNSAFHAAAGVDGVVVDNTVVTSYSGDGGNVIIPDEATEIGPNAFYDAGAVTSIDIPDTVTTIGSGAFGGCRGLTEITIPDSVENIGEGAFANCTGLESVTLPANAGNVPAGAFYNCPSLTYVAIPEGTSSIDTSAFAECTSLQQITIPSTLVSISSNAFSGDYNLTSITVEEGNPVYSAKAGCLYNAEGTEFYYCPEGKTSVNLVAGLEIIASGAFSSAQYVEEVKFPSSLTTISANAFAGSNVRQVTIPANVTYIGDQGDWEPDVIYGYSGTAAESYAKSHGIIFMSLDGQDPEPDDPNPVDPDDPTPGGGGGNGGGNGNGNGSGNSNVQPNGNGTVSAAEHVKDATPKTGVEDNPLFFLFIGIFLVGVAFIMASRIERPGHEE